MIAFIAIAYLLGIISALHLANLRGVDVRLLIPDKADHLLVWLAAFSYFEETLGSGTRIFKYTDGFLHEKAMLAVRLARLTAPIQ